jgi:Arc/MetJ family transcription regulator
MSRRNPLQHKGTSLVGVPAVRRSPAAAAGVGAGAAGGQRSAQYRIGRLMPKTLIDIDPELLEQAQQILGTHTKKSTVNTSLREVVRRWAVVEFGELARSGVFDGLLSVEPDKAAVPPLPEQPVEPRERACP